MLRRDKAIAKNDKRRLDGIQIKALTVSLAQALPAKDSLLEQPAVSLAVQQATQPAIQLNSQQFALKESSFVTTSITASRSTRASAYGPT